MYADIYMHRNVDEQDDLSEEAFAETRLLRHLEANHTMTILYLMVELSRLNESTDQQKRVKDALGVYCYFHFAASVLLINQNQQIPARLCCRS